MEEAKPIRIDYFWSKVDAIREATGEKKNVPTAHASR